MGQEHQRKKICSTAWLHHAAICMQRSRPGRSVPWVETNVRSNHTRFLPLGGSFPSRLLPLMLLLCSSFLQQRQAKADVGIEEGGFQANKLVAVLKKESWLLTKDRCTVGLAKNLVVDPEFNENFLQPQILRGDSTGVALCGWLDAMYEFHMKQKSKWKAKHRREKENAGGVFYLFKRVRLYFRSFPEFQVQFIPRYLALWHDDRFGKPMPWVSGYFCYDTREDKPESYGVFALSTPSCFVLEESDKSGRSTSSKTLVHLLLSPHPTVNRRMEQHERRVADKAKETLAAVVSGLAVGAALLAKQEDSERSRSNILVDALLGAYDMPMQIQDFWMRGTTCYIRTRFRVSPVLGVFLCHEVYYKGVNTGAYGLWKAHASQSVKLVVYNMDLFNSPEVRFSVTVSEGFIQPEGTGVLHQIALDTDPAVTPDYVHAVRLAKYIRIPTAIGQTVRIARNTLQAHHRGT